MLVFKDGQYGLNELRYDEFIYKALQEGGWLQGSTAWFITHIPREGYVLHARHKDDGVVSEETFSGLSGLISRLATIFKGYTYE